MILIINSAGTQRDFSYVPEKILPYSTALLTGHLRSRGLPVKHVDLRNIVARRLKDRLSTYDFDQYVKHDHQTILMRFFLRTCFEALPDLSDVKLAAISVLSYLNYPYALAIAKEIKRRRPGILVCLGGAYMTLKQFDLPEYVDFVVRGNGNSVLLMLAKYALHQGGLKDDADGLCCRIRGVQVDNDINQEKADSEMLPDFSDLELSRYEGKLNEIIKTPKKIDRTVVQIPYRLALGCKNDCSFCSAKRTDRYSCKSPDKVVRELKKLASLCKNPFIVFCDLSINNNPGLVREVLEKLQSDGVSFYWSAFAKFHGMDRSLLEKMAEAGCVNLIWGLESMDPVMLKKYNKNVSPQKSAQLLADSSRAGIHNDVLTIVGGPGDSLQGVDMLSELIWTHRRDPNIDFYFSRFRLEKGTDIFRNPGKFGIEIDRHSFREKYFFHDRIRWKDAGLSTEEFEEKQRRIYEKIQHLQTRLFLERQGIDTRNRLLLFSALQTNKLSETLRRLYLRVCFGSYSSLDVLWKRMLMLKNEN